MKRYGDLLLIEQNNQTEYIPISQIVYCESLKWSTKFHLVQPSYLIAKKTLIEVISIIDDQSFVQIDDTHFLNIKYIEQFNEKRQIMTTNLHDSFQGLLNQKK